MTLATSSTTADWVAKGASPAIVLASPKRVSSFFSVIMADKTLLTMAVILMTGSLLIMATF
jgi:hypothetical protein